MYVFLSDVVFGSKRFAIDGLAFLSQNLREPPWCPIYRWVSRGLEWAHDEKPGAGQGREVWTAHTGPRFLHRTGSLMPKHRLHREQRVFKGPDFMPHPPPHGVSPLFNSKQMKTTAETGVTMWQGLQVPFVRQPPTKVWDEI